MNFEFQFASLAEFWHMAGHGPYVWAAYALTFIGLSGLILQARLERKQIIKHIHLISLREAQQHGN